MAHEGTGSESHGIWDAHCHLQLAVARGEDLGELLRQAQLAGVSRVVVNGTQPSDWAAVADMAREDSQTPVYITPCFGVHPYWLLEAGDEKTWLPELESALAADPAAGIGETGLHKPGAGTTLASMEEQVSALHHHLSLARRLGRPITLHCVKAFGRLQQELHRAAKATAASLASGRAEWPLGAPVILHSYSGSADMVPGFVKLGCFFSFSGSVTRPKATKARAAAIAVPQDRLLVESDCPDQPPHGITASSPGTSLPAVLQALADLRGESVQELATATARTANSLFALPAQGDPIQAAEEESPDKA